MFDSLLDDSRISSKDLVREHLLNQCQEKHKQQSLDCSEEFEPHLPLC
jgi:hypothetical protein